MTTAIFSCLAGCADPPTEGGDAVEELGATTSELQVGGGGDIVRGPICLVPTVDQTKVLGGGTTAVGSATNTTCDAFVFEITETAGQDIVFYVLSKSLSSQGITVPTSTKCAESVMQVAIKGQLPDGSWQPLNSLAENGHWSGTSCFFPAFEQQKNVSGGFGIHKDSPYTRIRMSTRAILQTSSGPVTGEIKSIVHHEL